jgi:hypothetical protein
LIIVLKSVYCMTTGMRDLKHLVLLGGSSPCSEYALEGTGIFINVDYDIGLVRSRPEKAYRWSEPSGL